MLSCGRFTLMIMWITCVEGEDNTFILRNSAAVDIVP